MQRLEEANSTIVPFSPIFLCAVTFGALVRFLDIYWLASSTHSGFIDSWQGSVIGPFSVANLLLICASLLLAVAILDALRNPRGKSGWITVVFCLLLGCYVGGYQAFTQLMKEGRLSDFFSP
jgi:hypothetical protein